MHYKSILTIFLLIIISTSFLLCCGCTSSENNSCNATISEMTNLINSAVDRFSLMDFSNPDDFFKFQAEQSKKEMSTALSLMASENVRKCFEKNEYKNLIRLLELEYGLMDVYFEYADVSKTISDNSDKNYSEYQKNLKDASFRLGNLRYSIQELLILAGDIDESSFPEGINPDISGAKNQLESLLEKIDKDISDLNVYR